jgi:site-specific DNA-methyltransferase (adenine-specific)
MRTEQIGNITLHNCDNMEFMRTVPDKYFDLAICDPPYGIDVASDTRANTKHGKAATFSKKYGKKDWDKQTPEQAYYLELVRVSKNQIIWGANHLGFMPPSPCWIVWDKQNGDNGYADCELAYTSFESAVRMVSIKWHGMIQYDMKNKEDRIHPTQKPIPLYKFLLDKYAKEGDKILDTHLGSGSIAIACHDYKFELTGCEIDLDYFEASVKRLRNHVSQTVLF